MNHVFSFAFNAGVGYMRNYKYNGIKGRLQVKFLPLGGFQSEKPSTVLMPNLAFHGVLEVKCSF